MAKKRVSLTLDEDIVDRVDEKVESGHMNRSTMIEEILRDRFSHELDTAVIFCGDEESKSLEEHGGKPVVLHLLDHLASNGVEVVYMLTGRNRDQIEAVCGEGYSGVDLEYLSEDEAEGNAAALRKLEHEVSEPFVAVNGHVITDVDLDDMYRLHRNSDSVATIALTAVQDPSSYGAARLKGDTILGFEEKPDRGEEPSKLINAGTYIFEPGIFDRLDSSSIEEVFESLADERQLSGYIYGGKWADVSR